MKLHAIRVRADEGDPSSPLTMKTPFSIVVEYWNLRANTQLHITLHVYTEHEIVAFTTGSALDPNWGDSPMPAGLYRSVCHVPGELLNAGRHRFKVLIVKNKSSVIFQYESAVAFEIVDLDERNLSWYGREPGVVQPTMAMRGVDTFAVPLILTAPAPRWVSCSSPEVWLNVPPERFMVATPPPGLPYLLRRATEASAVRAETTTAPR